MLYKAFISLSLHADDFPSAYNIIAYKLTYVYLRRSPQCSLSRPYRRFRFRIFRRCRRYSVHTAISRHDGLSRRHARRYYQRRNFRTCRRLSRVGHHNIRRHIARRLAEHYARIHTARGCFSVLRAYGALDIDADIHGQPVHTLTTLLSFYARAHAHSGRRVLTARPGAGLMLALCHTLMRFLPFISRLISGRHITPPSSAIF